MPKRAAGKKRRRAMMVPTPLRKRGDLREGAAKCSLPQLRRRRRRRLHRQNNPLRILRFGHAEHTPHPGMEAMPMMMPTRAMWKISMPLRVISPMGPTSSRPMLARWMTKQRWLLKRGWVATCPINRRLICSTRRPRCLSNSLEPCICRRQRQPRL